MQRYDGSGNLIEETYFGADGRAANNKTNGNARLTGVMTRTVIR